MTKKPGLIVNLYHFILLCLLDVLFRVFNRVEVFGRENIPPKGVPGILILSNHISALDPLLIAITAMPRFSPVWWRGPAKEELFRSLLSSCIVRSIGGFPVRRGRHDMGSIGRMVDSLETSVLLVFPEGTWSETGKILPGRVGVGTVIHQALPVRIVPVALKGTDGILPRGGLIPRIGRRAKIVYGPPMDLTRFYSLPPGFETSQKIVAAVMEQIERLYQSL